MLFTSVALAGHAGEMDTPGVLPHEIDLRYEQGELPPYPVEF